jgi:WD40 repeat protein
MDFASGCELYTLEGHTAPVNDVTVTSDGRFAVSASLDNTLKVWDLGSGREVRMLGGRPHDVPRMAMTSDGRFAVSVSRGGTLKVWKLPLREHVYLLEGQASPATPVAVTPMGGSRSRRRRTRRPRCGTWRVAKPCSRSPVIPGA